MLLVSLFTQLFFFAAGIFGIGFLILIHELGHFLFCKLFDVSVPSFSIGFGPALWQKKIGETTFSLSAVPLGGYVEMAGSAEVGQGEQTEAYRDDEHSLLQKPYWQKICVMFGGILCNILFAYFATILVFMLGAPGTPLLPATLTATIEKIEPNSVAAQSGVEAGDTVIALNNVPLDLQDQSAFFASFMTLAGKTVPLRIKRGEQTKNVMVTFEKDKAPRLGAKFATHPLAPRSFTDAVREGVALTNGFIVKTAEFIGNLFTRRAGLDSAGGPVGIIAATSSSAQQGFKVYLLLLAFISINLAVLNLIPLPILDGGQALFYTIEALLRRRLPDNIKLGIHIACWGLFLLLTLYLTYYDIKRILFSALGW